MNRNREACTHSRHEEPASGRRLCRFLGILLFCLGLAPGVSAEVLDRVVANVNGAVITESELRETLDLYQRQAEMAARPAASEWEKKALQRRALEDLVDRLLMEEYARKQGITASDEEIEQAIQDVLGRANLKREQLLEALEKDGIPYKEYRDQIRDQIIKAKMIHREVRAQIVIKEEDIETYYFGHPEEFRAHEGYVLRHILLALPMDPQPEVAEAVLREAWRIREEILAGGSFAEAAGKYSQDPSATQGGWLGFFRKGALSREMESALGNLKEGELSEPIVTPTGIHLVKLEEKTAGDLRPLDKVRETIREKLYEEAAGRQFEEWRKELRKSAHIDVFL